jgi:alpha-glucosidase
MFMWNTDYPYFDYNSDPLYKSIPFFIGLNNNKAYGIFADSPSWSAFDMGSSSNEKYSFGTFSLNMDYYFIYGPKIKEVIRQYTDITGKIDLPPLWSIGYQQCRWSYYPEEKVKDLANTFRSKKIPCDVLYLDIDYMDSFKVYTSDKLKFPDLKKLTEYLNQRGIKLISIIDPGVKAEPGFDIYDEGLKNGYFIKKPSGKVFYADVWPGSSAFPDFLDTKVRLWWSSLQKRLLDEGVSGIWNDMNEPATFNTSGKTILLDAIQNLDGRKVDHSLVHNLYGMLENKATKEGISTAKPDERPFVLSRSTYAGGQKYSAVWMGDNTSNEEHLRLSISQCLNVGLSGFAFAGVDIGGFHKDPSPELYTRWLQMGVFFPLCRTHSVTGSNDQEPWSFGGGYEEINRKAIELRYRLLPYLYSLFHEASVTGLPILRSLVMEYQEDENTYEREDEFLLGENILVAPILELGKKERSVYFPSGTWYDFYSNTKYEGGSEYNVTADIDRIPVFIKEGSIIPEQKIMQYTNEQTVDKIILNIYPGEYRDNYLYEDDGISFGFLNNDYRLTHFSQITKEDKMFVNISKPEGHYNVMRTFLLNIRGIEKPFREIRYGFEDIKITEADDEFYRNLNIAYYDSAKKSFKIKFNDKSEEVLLTLIC